MNLFRLRWKQRKSWGSGRRRRRNGEQQRGGERRGDWRERWHVFHTYEIPHVKDMSQKKKPTLTDISGPYCVFRGKKKNWGNSKDNRSWWSWPVNTTTEPCYYGEDWLHGNVSFSWDRPTCRCTARAANFNCHQTIWTNLQFPRHNILQNQKTFFDPILSRMLKTSNLNSSEVLQAFH